MSENNIKIPFFQQIVTNKEGKRIFGFLEPKKTNQTPKTKKILGFALTKRRKIVITSIMIALLFFIFALQTADWTYYHIATLVLLGVTYILTLWILDLDLKGFEFLLFPLYPVLTSAVFMLLVPVFTKVGIPLILIALGMFIFLYLNLLTINILNIATVKFVPLSRVATNVYYFISLVLTILCLSVLYTSQLSYLAVVILVAAVSLLLGYPVIWFTAKKEGSQQGRMLYLIALLLMQVAWIFQFLPIVWHTAALILGLLQYLLISLFTIQLQSEVTRRVIIEYFIVGGLISLTLFLTLNWGAFS